MIDETANRSSRVVLKWVVAVAAVLLVIPVTRVTSFFRRDDRALVIVKPGADIDVDGAPHGADLTTLGGNIHVGQVDGFARLKTMGGDIEVGAASGSVDATTMSGNIEVHVVGPPAAARDISLSSNQGEITLVVPKDFAMTVEVTLAYTDNQTEAFRVVDNVGLRQVRKDDWDRSHGTPRKYIYASGRVGSGRNHVVISTINGNVTLNSR